MFIAVQAGCGLTWNVTGLQRPFLVPDPDCIRIVLVVRLPDERHAAAGIERLVVDVPRTKGDTRDRNDEHAFVFPAHAFTRRRVPQVEPRAAALEPETQPLAQNSSVLRTASTTRSTDGMYASSICQYGYGTS
jgi:hypothetical protein